MLHWPQHLYLACFSFIAFTALIHWALRKRHCPCNTNPSSRRRLFLLAVSLLSGALLTATLTLAWYFYRPQPAPLDHMPLHPGITYTREVRSTPRPLVIHIVEVDLPTPGLSFLVTPGKPDDPMPLIARTTTEFAREFKMQLAINGDYFSPWFSHTPWDYAPHSGDPAKVHGIAASRGTLYTEGERKWAAPTLYLSKANVPSLTRPTNDVYNAISGNLFLVRDGIAKPYPVPDSNLPEPRTAIGFDQARTRLIIIVVDGRQPNYSEGMDVDELAQLFVKYGAWSAINLDGGGSSTLVNEDQTGTWSVLNCPAHTRIPGRERPVANHLGIQVLR